MSTPQNIGGRWYVNGARNSSAQIDRESNHAYRPGAPLPPGWESMAGVDICGQIREEHAQAAAQAGARDKTAAAAEYIAPHEDRSAEPGVSPEHFGFDRATGAVGFHSLVKASKSPRENVNHIGTSAVLQHREWSGEWRMRCQTDAPMQMPPQQEGQRKTKKLSEKGARTITNSCEYVATIKRPYKTFITLTFDKFARARMLDHDAEAACTVITFDKKGAVNSAEHFGQDTMPRTLKGATIQKEVSRFFDGLQKAHKGGMKLKREDGSYSTIKKTEKPLMYCWVAENPLNSDGKDNPHVHVMMSWAVHFDNFKPWAARLERLWGQGFAHLERIKSSSKTAAAAYMAKAANYMSKGAEGGQGEIRGNRYGMSASARAPQWVTVKHYAWHKLGVILERARFTHKARTMQARVARSNATRAHASAPKGEAKKRAKIALQKARKKYTEKAAGFYFTRCAVVADSWEKIHEFFKFAERKGWKAQKKPLFLYTGMLLEKIKKLSQPVFQTCDDYWREVLKGGEPVQSEFDLANWHEYATAN